MVKNYATMSSFITGSIRTARPIAIDVVSHMFIHPPVFKLHRFFFRACSYTIFLLSFSEGKQENGIAAFPNVADSFV